jgi:hypothetical protein
LDEQVTYHVVGVGADGVREIVDEGLTLERANRVRTLLVNANAFPDVGVEPDGPPERPSPVNHHHFTADRIAWTNQTQHFCNECGRNTLHARPSFSPWLGLGLTAVTGGLFLVPWIFIAITDPHRRWRCQTCGALHRIDS